MGAAIGDAAIGAGLFGRADQAGGIDQPGDGLDDFRELSKGVLGQYDAGLDTFPTDADSDDDGISDGDEVNGTGPLAGYGPTNPLVRDTDGDGIVDGVEVGVTAPVESGWSAGHTAYAGTDVSIWRPP